MLNPRSFFLALLFTFSTCAALGQSWKDQFRDTLDQRFDISVWLDQVYGYLPVIGIITEPALGIGGSASLLNIRKKHNETGNSKIHSS